MPRPVSPTISVLLLDSRPVRARRHHDSVVQTPGVHSVGQVRDLMQAYHLTEHEQPDLVVMAEEETRRPNFAMFGAMLSALEITCIVMQAGVSATPPAGYPVVTDAEITAAGGLGPYLARHHARGSVPVDAQSTHAAPRRAAPTGWKVVVMGASTGGVDALIEILRHYPELGPPTLIVQHIGPRFLPGLAQRLDRHCAGVVRPARSTDAIAPGRVLLAPGDTAHMTVMPSGRHCRLVPGPPESGHRPSVDALFRSAAVLGTGAVGVLLTGMGRDGAAGLAEIRRAGGMTFAQDASSATVYGMPRAAQENGAVVRQLPLGSIGPALLAAAESGERAPHD